MSVLGIMAYQHTTEPIFEDIRMWIQIILVSILIKSSEGGCERKFLNNKAMCTRCTNITPNEALSSKFLPKLIYPVYFKEYLFISNSSIPELTQDMFSNFSFSDITIQANVEIIQSEVFQDIHVTSLVLDNNDIKIIKDMSFSSPTIEFLSLQNNSLREIKVNNFQGMPQLKNLKLKYNSISDIEQDSFNSLTNLRELDLSFNKLVELDFGAFQFTTRLQTIYLNNNLLRSLSDNIFSQCKNLSYLNIASNFLTIIDFRSYPNSLLSINASNNLLESVDFSNLVNAHTINLNFNNLESITDSLYNMSSLKYLYLNYNSLGPSMETNAFHQLKTLTILELDGNGLENINFMMLNNFPNLQTVSLAANKFTSLDISNLSNPSVMTLILRKNFLKEIRNLSNKQNLNKLDLSYNNFEEIRYDTFQYMINLTQLWLQHNSIRFLQLGCFRNMHKLRELNLSYNQITNLEIGIFGGLDEIITLDISYNNLAHLDENIFHNINSKLRTLNISYNFLSDFNISNVGFRTYFLRTVSLNGNNWTCKALLYNFKKMYLNRGTSYNVTNVFGIPCKNTESNISYNTDVPSNKVDDMRKYFDSIEGYDKEISSKITVIIVVLIVLLILFCVKFTFPKCCSFYAATRQFVYERYRNEPDMQLT